IGGGTIWKVGAALGVLAVAILLGLLAASQRRDTSGHVRVNQIGYEAGRPMRAYLMAMKPETGAKFEVSNPQGNAVYSADIGGLLGNWGKYNVYALDFTTSAPDTYTVTVTGPAPGTSPSFRVGAPAQLYSEALANALSFYQNQ